MLAAVGPVCEVLPADTVKLNIPGVTLAASIVTVAFAAITTSSDEPGFTPPIQVVPSFQFPPILVEVMVAART